MNLTFSATVRADWSLNLTFWRSLSYSSPSLISLKYLYSQQWPGTRVRCSAFLKFTAENAYCDFQLSRSTSCSLHSSLVLIVETPISENEACISPSSSVHSVSGVNVGSFSGWSSLSVLFYATAWDCLGISEGCCTWYAYCNDTVHRLILTAALCLC